LIKIRTVIFIFFQNMSFFNNKTGSGGSSWGSMLKQAMNTVESRLDKALEVSEGKCIDFFF
jgi:hypothetical protein